MDLWLTDWACKVVDACGKVYDDWMTGVRKRGEAIRRFILENIGEYPDSIASVSASKFNVTRQAIHKHLRRMVDERALVSHGRGHSRWYELAAKEVWREQFQLVDVEGEDVIWRGCIEPHLEGLTDNALGICHHGFTEMFNNVIDHSEAVWASVVIVRSALDTEIRILDSGIGIFRKIQEALGLADEKQSVLELAKGKFTTAPDQHSGEGIFFTSKMFDSFSILSGRSAYYGSEAEDMDFVTHLKREESGTFVCMKIINHTSRTAKSVFDQYTVGDDFAFNRTLIPVGLAEYGDDQLISRSQAKRLMARLEHFDVVVFDFKDVQHVGQAFADEVFRVFQLAHPAIQLSHMNASKGVLPMIMRAVSKLRESTELR